MVIGALVVRFQHVKQGRMCSRCTSNTFWGYTLTTLFLGWWSITSFFATPLVLVMNVITYCCTFLSSPYPEDPVPLILSSTLVTTLESYRNEIFQRVFKGENLQQVAEDIGARVGASSADVMAVYNNTFSIDTMGHPDSSGK